jgi:olefin beta-lactone synthetase
MNLLGTFERQVAAFPDRIALVDPNGREWSYRALDRRGQALAAQFARQGLGRGDRVLLALGVDAELYAALAALWRIGAVAVLPEPALGLAGLRRALELAAPDAVLLGGVYRLLPLIVPQLRRLRIQLRLCTGSRSTTPGMADLPADAPALISFTTGSTGAPKAIVRSHGFMHAQEAAVAPLIGTGGRTETDLVGFPVFVVANLGQGITSVLPDWPARRLGKASSARIARLIQRQGVSRLLLNPELVWRLAEHGIPGSIKAIFTGGGPVFPDMIETIRKARPDVAMIAVYGSTEAEPIAELDVRDIAPADFAAMANGSGLLAGYPVAGIQLRISEHEIQVAGAHVVQGYLDPAQDCETKLRDADGTLWHRTGDAGYLDRAGRLWLLGRVKDRAGAHWPFAIETAARRWPGVQRAALAPCEEGPVLAIEGNAREIGQWSIRAGALGIASVRHLQRIPMDKRHGSKVDMARLRDMLN